MSELRGKVNTHGPRQLERLGQKTEICCLPRRKPLRVRARHTLPRTKQFGATSPEISGCALDGKLPTWHLSKAWSESQRRGKSRGITAFSTRNRSRSLRCPCSRRSRALVSSVTSCLRLSFTARAASFSSRNMSLISSKVLFLKDVLLCGVTRKISWNTRYVDLFNERSFEFLHLTMLEFQVHLKFKQRSI